MRGCTAFHGGLDCGRLGCPSWVPERLSDGKSKPAQSLCVDQVNKTRELLKRLHGFSLFPCSIMDARCSPNQGGGHDGVHLVGRLSCCH